MGKYSGLTKKRKILLGLIYKKRGNLPCCALGVQIPLPPLIIDFRILAPAGGSNPAGPYLNPFPNTEGQS